MSCFFDDLIHCKVPQRPLNLPIISFCSDMEWLNNPRDAQNMEVDIGYMPQMELKSTRPSVSALHAGQDHRETQLQPTDDYEKSIEDIVWKKEISQAEARRKLEIKMYPFKKVSICIVPINSESVEISW